MLTHSAAWPKGGLSLFGSPMRLFLILALVALTTLIGCANHVKPSRTISAELPAVRQAETTPQTASAQSPQIVVTATHHSPPANFSHSIRSAIALSASQLVGARTLTSQGKQIAYDCAGVTRAIFLKHGIDLYSNVPRDPTANGVRVIYTHVQRHGTIHQGPIADPGDLVFFDNTWDFNGDGQLNDPLTHIGVVEQLEPDGTVVFISRVSGAIERYRMNLDWPHIHKTAEGRILNDYIRRKLPTDPEETNRLTGELFSAFGNRLIP